MNDLELLKLAAKAAGIAYDEEMSKPHPVSGAWWGLWLKYYREPHEFDRRNWNPLTDDGDALRLAVKLQLAFKFVDYGQTAFASCHKSGLAAEEDTEVDPYAATRRAIVRAAAEIGKRLG